MSLKEFAWFVLALVGLILTQLTANRAINNYKWWSAVTAMVSCVTAGVDPEKCREIVLGKDAKP